MAAERARVEAVSSCQGHAILTKNLRKVYPARVPIPHFTLSFFSLPFMQLLLSNAAAAVEALLCTQLRPVFLNIHLVTSEEDICHPFEDVKA